ncbi:MAG: RNA pseudouridine synthase [Desulfobacterales bacterium]|nr:RNA pseudouridine synthase [Desulfobacterales bacterium]
MDNIKFKTIIACGKGWLVVNKPAGMSVHNEPGQDLCSVVYSYIKNNPDIQEKTGFDSVFGVNPVHRLDRETSGVIMLAVDKVVFRYFSKEFEDRQVKKQYCAIIHGKLENLVEKDEWGTWDRPLAQIAGGRKNPAGKGPKQVCKTRFRIIDYSAHYTMTEIEILSGRKHQIRRHAKLSGHPVVGDARYGSKRAIDYLKNQGFERIALHSKSLSIYLPDEEDLKTFEAPIPKQMQELFDKDCAGNET